MPDPMSPPDRHAADPAASDTGPSPVKLVPLEVSSRHLLRSTVLAFLVAAALLVTVVLPAEHGIDPTGIGSVLGLTDMGEIKAALERESAAASHVGEPIAIARNSPEQPVPPRAASNERTGPAAPPNVVLDPQPPTPNNSHVSQIVLAPGEGKEIKLVMRRDARVTYSWSTDRGVVNYDAHADAPGIKYHGYAKGFGEPSDEGVLVAAFDGAHGWFWRNRGQETVTITLKTDGDYLELRKL